MKIILSICTAMFGLLVNSLLGATIALCFGGSALVGAFSLNILSVITALFNIAPKGVLSAGVFTEVWTGHLIKAFKTSMESVGWYKRAKSFDQYVENDVIHLVALGVNPKVLIDNDTYPIGVSTTEDADKPIQLSKFQTERTIVRDDTLHAISYDRISADLEKHKDAISDAVFKKAAHALSPSENKAKTPVYKTSGQASKIEPTRKAFTMADLLKLKQHFDNLKVPISERILVLCSDHVNDILALDEKFANQYANSASGVIAKRFGFEIYEYQDCPTYNVESGKKNPLDKILTQQDNMASFAFVASKVLRADGNLKMYYAKAENNPSTQASEVNFRKYSICLPMEDSCCAAIYSDNA